MADLPLKIKCTYCQDYIADVFIRCSVCPDFDLCLQCYSWGVELGDHRNDHSYHLMGAPPTLSLPSTSTPFTRIPTQGILSNGVGNLFGSRLTNGGRLPELTIANGRLEDASDTEKSTTDSIFPGKSSWAANEHVRLLDGIEQFGYGNWEDISKHIETKGPEEAKNEYITHFLDGAIGRATWGSVQSTSHLVDHVPYGSRIPANPHSSGDGETTSREAVRNDECAQLGYMPKRDDYEREFDHEAEQMVSSLSVATDDDELDTALKMAVICAYNRRIAERIRRKAIAKDYQLIPQFFYSINNRQPRTNDKFEKEKKDFADKLRIFAQLMPKSDHKALEENLWGERLARMRLAELYHYRMNGLTSLEECEHYEQHASYRRHCHMRNHLAGSSGGTTNHSSHHTHDRNHTNRNNPKRRENANDSSSTSPRSTRDASIVCGCYRKRFYSKTRGCNVNDSTANTQRASVALGPSHHLLTNSEQQICSTLNVAPDVYLTMKTMMLSNNRAKYLFNQSPLVKVECDLATENTISRYISRSGWNRSPQPS